ncbi:MAG: thioredoxin family protein [Acidobacteriaceae bacterium]
MRVSRILRAVAVCTVVVAATASSASVRPALSLQGRAQFQMATADLYPATANAHEDIRQAILKAAAEHKNVLLVFGGNWCIDCHLLDLYFHDPGNASLLAANYVLVNVNIGEYDKNLDLARKYGIPLSKGVPALVVLDGAGHVLYAQRNAEFENMRVKDASAVTAFLEKWKPRPTHKRVATHRKSQVSETRPGAPGALYGTTLKSAL